MYNKQTIPNITYYTCDTIYANFPKFHQTVPRVCQNNTYHRTICLASIPKPYNAYNVPKRSISRNLLQQRVPLSFDFHRASLLSKRCKQPCPLIESHSISASLSRPTIDTVVIRTLQGLEWPYRRKPRVDRFRAPPESRACGTVAFGTYSKCKKEEHEGGVNRVEGGKRVHPQYTNVIEGQRRRKGRKERSIGLVKRFQGLPIFRPLLVDPYEANYTSPRQRHPTYRRQSTFLGLFGGRDRFCSTYTGYVLDTATVKATRTPFPSTYVISLV